MRELPLKDIKTKALQFHESGLKWHFHILTPTCSLNEKPKYAFVLECPDQHEGYVHYSDQAEKVLGQELAPLLHGAKVLNQETTSEGYEPSSTVSKIIARAKKLNAQDTEWHHHLLYPGCQFNTHSPQFELIFEDPKARETLQSLSDKEPTNDLKQIEGLFYKK